MSPPRSLAIIPAYNEARVLPGVLRGLREHAPDLDVVVVDDGSGDDTSRVALKHGAQVLRHVLNLGYGAALETGFQYAWQQGYDEVVTLDADGQHPPAEVIHLLAALREGRADVILGSRFLGRGDYQAPWLRRLGICLFRTIARAATGLPLTDPTTGFQALSRRALRACLYGHWPHDYPDVEVLIRLHRRGLTMTEVPVMMLPPPEGDVSMHDGLMPFYYVYKNAVAIPLALLFTGRPS